MASRSASEKSTPYQKFKDRLEIRASRAERKFKPIGRVRLSPKEYREVLKAYCIENPDMVFYTSRGPIVVSKRKLK